MTTDKEYFIIKKDGEVYKTDREGAYEKYTEFGEENVTIEYHNPNGWVWVGRSMWKVTLKSGNTYYGLVTLSSYKEETRKGE